MVLRLTCTKSFLHIFSVETSLSWRHLSFELVNNLEPEGFHEKEVIFNRHYIFTISVPICNLTIEWPFVIFEKLVTNCRNKCSWLLVYQNTFPLLIFWGERVLPISMFMYLAKFSSNESRWFRRFDLMVSWASWMAGRRMVWWRSRLLR